VETLPCQRWFTVSQPYDESTSNLFLYLQKKHPANYEVAVQARKQQQQDRKKEET